VRRRWEQVDTRHPWTGEPIEIVRVYRRHFFHWRALRSARFYDRLTRQPYGDRASYRIMIRDRCTGELESVREAE
jgi:hypothetical protein